MKVLKVISLFIFSFNFAFVQQEKSKILSQFDKIEYYQDSTIMGAYKIKNGVYEGYSIEFNQKGEPTAIGRYRSGKKQYWWINSDNKAQFYNEGNVIRVRCGTGMPSNIKSEYFQIINGLKQVY